MSEVSEVKKILVVGDIMIDRYHFVNTSRTAPEAKIPVWDNVSRELRLGGAANVAHNIKSLGQDDVEVHLAGILEPRYRGLVKRYSIETILCSGIETMVKDRFVNADSYEYLFRFDNMIKFKESSIRHFETSCNHFLPGRKWDAIVYSDYDKGTITEEVVNLLRYTSDLHIVDSKRLDLSIFSGMNVLKINEHEYSRQVSSAPYPNVEGLFENVVVTKGSKGAQLRQSNSVPVDQRTNIAPVIRKHMYSVASEEFPVISVNSKDVTGCGDTHTAGMAFSLLKNRDDIRMAVRFGNECAKNVVQKFGTSVVKI